MVWKRSRGLTRRCELQLPQTEREDEGKTEREREMATPVIFRQFGPLCVSAAPGGTPAYPRPWRVCLPLTNKGVVARLSRSDVGSD